VDRTDARWRTSSYSGNSGGGCVEVAFLPDGAVGVRDTKDRTRAPHRYPASQWAAFLADVRTGRFGRG
jgi:Domain of unknown function (DUF397)